MTPSAPIDESALAATLVELIVIIVLARLAGALAVFARQPRAVGEIVAGLMLGPSLLGALSPTLFAAIFQPGAATPIEALSQIGLLLLMFQIGADFEFHRLVEAGNGRAVVRIAAASLAAPLALGFGFAWVAAPFLAPDVNRLLFSGFSAVALAITAVPILGRILREYRLVETRLGLVAISAAALNDLVGWVLLATLAALATAKLSAASVGGQLGGLGALAAGLWVIGRPMATALLARFPLRDGQVPGAAVALVIAAIFACGLTTRALGVFTILGGFLVGLLFHRDRAFVAAWRRQIGGLVLVFFLPIFFASTGLKTNVFGLDSPADWGWAGAFLALAAIAKIAPVFAAAKSAGFAPAEAAALGALMNTRALMALIVLNVGRSLGLLPDKVFTMLVLMALGTTMMTGPLLRRSLARAGHDAVPHDEA